MVDQGGPVIHGETWGGGSCPCHPSPTPLYHNFIFRIMRDQKLYVEKVILCTPPPYLICALSYSLGVLSFNLVNR